MRAFARRSLPTPHFDGEFELLCGVQFLDDPAVAVMREFPVSVRVVECRTKTPTAKPAC